MGWTTVATVIGALTEEQREIQTLRVENRKACRSRDAELMEIYSTYNAAAAPKLLPPDRRPTGTRLPSRATMTSAAGPAPTPRLTRPAAPAPARPGRCSRAGPQRAPAASGSAREPSGETRPGAGPLMPPLDAGSAQAHRPGLSRPRWRRRRLRGRLGRPAPPRPLHTPLPPPRGSQPQSSHPPTAPGEGRGGARRARAAGGCGVPRRTRGPRRLLARLGCGAGRASRQGHTQGPQRPAWGGAGRRRPSEI